ncbi:hypothetical protein PMAYCL1PPCAC_20026, partial [Pristionchus mayeri]
DLCQFSVVLLHHLATTEAEEPVNARLVQLCVECASDDDRVVPQALRIQSASEYCIYVRKFVNRKINAFLSKIALRLIRASTGSASTHSCSRASIWRCRFCAAFATLRFCET